MHHRTNALRNHLAPRGTHEFGSPAGGAEAGSQGDPAPARAGALPPAFDAALDEARALLRELDADSAAAPWRLSSHGQEVFTIPKAGLVRTLMLNHWYHHRGQLVVYFRCLDVPVPAVYGRSADEMLFG